MKEVYCQARVDLDSFMETVREDLSDKDKAELVLSITDNFEHEESLNKLLKNLFRKGKYLCINSSPDGDVHAFVSDKKWRNDEITLADMNEECLIAEKGDNVKLYIDLQKLVTDLGGI